MDVHKFDAGRSRAAFVALAAIEARRDD